MAKYTLTIIRAEKDGTKKQVEIPLPVGDVLTVEDLFTVEFTLNLIPHLRCHINQVEE